MRSVRGAERDVAEERAIGAHALAVGDHLQHLIDEILRHVVAVVGAGRWLDGVVVAHQLGMELVGLAVEEAVEAVEAPAEGPLVERPGGRALLHGCEMPLADGEGGVAVVAQHLGDRGGSGADVAEHVGEAGAEVGHRAHAGPVLRPSGEQGGTGGGAQGSDVEVGELQSVARERIDVRRVDLAAVAAELGEPGVVEQHDHDVRGVAAGVRELLEPGLRLGQCAADRSFESSDLMDPPRGSLRSITVDSLTDNCCGFAEVRYCETTDAVLQTLVSCCDNSTNQGGLLWVHRSSGRLPAPRRIPTRPCASPGRTTRQWSGSHGEQGPSLEELLCRSARRHVTRTTRHSRRHCARCRS